MDNYKAVFDTVTNDFQIKFTLVNREGQDLEVLITMSDYTTKESKHFQRSVPYDSKYLEDTLQELRAKLLKVRAL